MAFFKDSQATAFDVGRADKEEILGEDNYYSVDVTRAADEITGDKRAGAKLQTYYVDGTDSLANRGLTINLVHVPTGTGVRFKAFLMAFNESYNSDWSSESVYGRADPIHMFKQTSRNISLAWKIVAATEGEAIENLVRLQRFLQMLYPTYTEKNSAQTINQSPLIRLQMSNMIRKAAVPKNLTELRQHATTAALPTGLLGIIKNVSVTHNMENPEVGAFELGTPGKTGFAGGHTTNNIVPKAIEVQMDFSVVHEHMLGWTKEGDSWTFGGGAVGANSDAAAFPYYVKAQEDADRLSPQQRALANQVWMRQTRIDVDRDALKASEAARQTAEAKAGAMAGGFRDYNLEDHTAAMDALTTQTEAHNSLVAELLGE
jgi:hypothetical protein